MGNTTWCPCLIQLLTFGGNRLEGLGVTDMIWITTKPPKR